MSTTLFSKKVFSSKNGGLFMDVNRNEKGVTYVKITQSKRQEDQTFKHEAVFIFDDKLPEFIRALTEAQRAIPRTNKHDDSIFT